MKRQLMAEQWNSFSQAVMTKNTPAIQRQEMRRAFYAGAQAILFRVIGMIGSVESEPTEVTEADLQIMQDLEDELRAFAVDVIAGRA